MWMEAVKRLQQQNACLQKQNISFRDGFDGLIREEFNARNIMYLEEIADSFYKISDNFLKEIEKQKAHKAVENSDQLFVLYQDAMKSCRRFKNRIADSFKHCLPDRNINGFTRLDRSQFELKYFEQTNKGKHLSGLLLLETDALLNEQAVMEDVIEKLTPFCSFVKYAEVAMAIADKCSYRQGDTLKITTLVTKYPRYFKGTATIEGKQIKSDEGLILYSRKITESSGSYRVPITISWQDNNMRLRSLPARVNFEVEQ